MAPATGALKTSPVTSAHMTGISVQTLPGLREGYSSEKFSTSLEICGYLLLDALRSSKEGSRYVASQNSFEVL